MASSATHLEDWLQAANVLLSADGSVLLADFGVTATLERATNDEAQYANDGASTSSKQHCGYLTRNTFVGTVTFMAPEVMQEIESCALSEC